MPESKGSEQGDSGRPDQVEGVQGEEDGGGGAVVRHREEGQGGGGGIQTLSGSQTAMGISGELRLFIVWETHS